MRHECPSFTRPLPGLATGGWLGDDAPGDPEEGHVGKDVDKKKNKDCKVEKKIYRQKNFRPLMEEEYWS